jgi:hypothetical protein
MSTAPVTLFDPLPAYREGSGRFRGGNNVGENPPGGAVIKFYLKDAPGDNDNFQVDITDAEGTLVKSFRNNLKDVKAGSDSPYSKLELKKGFNIVSWDLSYPGAMPVDGMIMWGGNLRGPVALPGNYKVKMLYNDFVSETTLNVIKNPTATVTDEELKEQFDFIEGIRDKLTEIHKVIVDTRGLRSGIQNVLKKLDKDSQGVLIGDLEDIVKQLSAIEEDLYQVKNRSSQDPLNYPIKLGNKLAALNGVVATGDFRPTDQAYLVRDELLSKINPCLDRFYRIRDNAIPGLNERMRAAGVDYLESGK